METLTPNIFVKSMNETVQFYKMLGFEVTMSVPDVEEYVWCMMSKGKANIMFQSFESLGDDLPQIKRTEGAPLLFYFKMGDLMNFFNELKNKVNILKDPEVTFYGSNEFSILDNNGFILTFAEDEH